MVDRRRWCLTPLLFNLALDQSSLRPGIQGRLIYFKNADTCVSYKSRVSTMPTPNIITVYRGTVPIPLWSKEA